ncbi:MAG: squalene/phytoene synthase family protein [Calditrichaeota bacterium]|nr:MAG: squalene/phytoene synthase family protein [Calditrichota bacterium]MBL1205975.1 squalene/phytoene synthase family protein [Calditrichota bacterium]NOG45803.1 squalene/phytoene synthase family protein [Calditrichota bacterium]
MTKLTEDIVYCDSMLPKVSRTFAPTIRMLPKGLNSIVTVAYLLCRVADTVEDSEDLPIDIKKELLNNYIAIFKEENPASLDRFMAGIIELPTKTHDEQLVYNLPRIMNVFYSFSPIFKKHIGQWVIEMSVGMHKYAQANVLRKFSFLGTMKELDEYMYYVAGTVGYLLTELFAFYSNRITPPIKKKLNLLAESFGKGLQMVNIIRDMTTDLRRGQSYIPEELLEKYKLNRKTIFEKQNADKAEQLFNELIQNAVKHLDKAIDYILLLPKEERGIRMFCMLPVFWAMRTLQKIQENTLALLGHEKVKVSRKMIKKEYYLAFINIYSNRLTRRHYQSIRNQFENLQLSPVSN